MPQQPSTREIPPAARAFFALQAEDVLLPSEASPLRRSGAIALAAIAVLCAPLYWTANAIGLVGDLPTAVAQQGSTSDPGGDDDGAGGSGEGDDGDGGDDSSMPEGGAAGALGPGDAVDPAVTTAGDGEGNDAANGDPGVGAQDVGGESETDSIAAPDGGVNGANDGQDAGAQDVGGDSETASIAAPAGDGQIPEGSAADSDDTEEGQQV